ncbi:MAG TPA: hypothetical protein VKH41_14860 [Myxococcota bacterium]|nr:hypothetical protein [Myxococcota bacterium]
MPASALYTSALGALFLTYALAPSAPAAEWLPAAMDTPDVSARMPDAPEIETRTMQMPRIVFITGTVDAVDKDFLGRTRRVAIVSVGNTGALFQNAIEDMAAGEELKHHVGEAVTARGVVLVKVDGSMSLLVDAFQVHGEKGGFFGGNPHRDK